MRTRLHCLAGTLLLTAALAAGPAQARDPFGLDVPLKVGPSVLPRLDAVEGKPGCYREGALFKLRGRSLGSATGLAVAADFAPPTSSPGAGHVHLAVETWRPTWIAVRVKAPAPKGASAAWIGIEDARSGHGRWIAGPLKVAVCNPVAANPVTTLGTKVPAAGGAKGGWAGPGDLIAQPEPGQGEWGGEGQEGGGWYGDDGEEGGWESGDEGTAGQAGSLGGGLLAKALPEPPPPPAAASGDEGDVEPGEVLVASADVREANALAQDLAQEGFRLRRRQVLKALGMVLTTFRVPEGMRVREAVEALRRRYPDLWIDANHRYGPMSLDESAAPLRYARALVGWHGGAGCGRGLVLGLADGPVDADHPALAGRDVAIVSLLGPGTGPAPPSHGTALAGLLVGTPETGFDGLLPAASLRVAVVLRARDGGRKVDTTAELIVRAVDTFVGAGAHAAVLSLGGPPNRLLELAVRLAEERGLALAAAAGNGGQERPVYPAGYPQVLGVTAVDADRRPFRKANRGAHVAIAAPGVDLWVAAPGASGRYATGTSYAVPFVAAALALERARGAGPAQARARLLEAARDLGPPGPDPRFGHGLLRHPGCGRAG